MRSKLGEGGRDGEGGERGRKREGDGGRESESDGERDGEGGRGRVESQAPGQPINGFLSTDCVNALTLRMAGRVQPTHRRPQLLRVPRMRTAQTTLWARAALNASLSQA